MPIDPVVLSVSAQQVFTPPKTLSRGTEHVTPLRAIQPSGESPGDAHSHQRLSGYLPAGNGEVAAGATVGLVGGIITGCVFDPAIVRVPLAARVGYFATGTMPKQVPAVPSSIINVIA